MIGFGCPLLLAALAAQSPAADSLRQLAGRLPQSALVVETRARPLATREAVAEALIRTVRTPSAGKEEFAAARRLAEAYAVAWSDPFLVNEVTRFAARPPEQRAAKVRADSLRRAGVAAYHREGVASATLLWRRSLSRAQAIRDTTAIAAVLGNLGSGYLDQRRLDSAKAYLERARGLAAAVGDFRVEGNAVGELANVSKELGDLAAARRGFTRALTLRERIGDTRGIAADQHNLGLLAQETGDLEEARRSFEAALALNRREGRDEVGATNLMGLAGLASLAGDYPRADALYRDALAIWRAREQWADAADALHGLGQLELRRGDYPAARAALGESLAIYERTGRLADALILRRELADALAAVGELQGALDQLSRAQQQADSARVPLRIRAGIVLARGDLAVQMNALASAERLYGQAQLLYRQAADPVGEAEAKQGQGLLLLSREDYPRALTLLQGALRTQVAAGDQRAAALTRLSLGQLSRVRGDPGLARRQLARAAADLDRLGDPVGAAAAVGEWAAVEADSRPAVAESLYRAGLARLSDRMAPEIAWRLHAGLGLARRAQGAVDEAARELRAAITEIDRPSRSLALAERRSTFLADKWEIFAQLALTERGRGRIGSAFEASERLRASEMREVLARGRLALPSDTTANIVSREQDLRRRIAELTRALGEPSASREALRGPDVSSSGGPVRGALLQAQEAYAELLLEMRERAPRHATLVSRDPASWREVARRLAPDQAFIEYLVSDSASLAFLITRDTVVVEDLGLGRHNLTRLVEFVRGTLEQHGSALTDSLWRGPLRRLHRHLIAPLEETGLLAGKTRLVLVPHAELHYLPFASLIGDDGPRSRGSFLVERYDLTVTPSASVWLALADRPAGRAQRGVLALAPRPDALPASRQEIAAIARLAGAGVHTLTGSAATEEAFRREAPSRQVIHLATYGVLNKQNPLFSFVELASDSAHDGRLEAHEVFGLHLEADLVVLSACQTGLGSGSLADVPAGDDWVGLSRAFLHAGAKQVVATLWAVDDWSTAELMERFYQGFQSGTDPSRALAQAQRALLAARATAHPFYWAGFVVAGGGEVRGLNLQQGRSP